ncbi:MAG: ABC transporter permease [Alphaproteobacteria bacterium]|nr:ABC transporter permease [Alphaproteobacteria bacterium]
MGALDRKLLRDLWRLRGQVLAIALVIASGVAVLVMSFSSIEALESTGTAYYERYHFAEVFAGVERAPDKIARRIADIPGVQNVETRIVKFATLDIAGFEEPVIGQLISIPERGQSVLNRLALRTGRLVAPGRPDEVVLSEPFAQEHGLVPGDRLQALMNGKKRALDIVGIALSPEYVYAIGPGQLVPDEKRFGILWMGREALEAAYDFDGAFNDVSLTLLRGVNVDDVISRLDTLLDRYGGVGAFARADQLSNFFLTNEIEQLRSIAKIMPAIFLAVAAFLSNIVVARLIALERAEIGLMKAFGYSNVEVGWHYTKMVIVMAGVGIVIGWGAGAWLGRINTEIFAEFFRFPFLFFRPGPAVFALAGVITMAAALLGTVSAVRRAVILPPAEAMRPPAPPLYRKTRLRSAWVARWLDQPTRIILRQVLRWPIRSLFASAGVGLALAVLITSLQWFDSIDRIAEVFFHQAQRQDVTVGLVEAQSSTVVAEFERLPGVLAAEPERAVAVKFRSGIRTHRGAISGVVSEPTLSLVFDASGGALRVPPKGLVLSTELATKLGVGRGDMVEAQVLDGRRPKLELPVVDLFETYIGAPAFMNIAALNRALKEGPHVDIVHLLVDRDAEPRLFAELKDLPDVAAVTLRRAATDTFYETVGETLLIQVSFFVAFGCTLAFGVVYNSMRIALSERGREFATLRVLGFGRAEISYILIGEAALLIFVGLPLGCLAGYSLAWLITSEFGNELYRIPLALNPSTFGIAVLIGIAAAAVSAAIVRQRLDNLDLIAVLKTRE